MQAKDLVVGKMYVLVEPLGRYLVTYSGVVETGEYKDRHNFKPKGCCGAILAEEDIYEHIREVPHDRRK